ncbi:MAG: DUF4830 domain-containing protein [Huintestinicola sp.]
MDRNSRNERSRRKSKGIFLGVVLIILGAMALWLLAAKDEAEADKMFTFESNSERVRFLNRQGYIVEPDPETQDVTIPAVFDEKYTEYNQLQLDQGFDLEPYAGKDAVLYTYKVLNYPDYPENITANLLFDDHRLIGADISYNDAENGFTRALITSPVEITPSETDESVSETETGTSQEEAAMTEPVTETVTEAVTEPVTSGSEAVTTTVTSAGITRTSRERDTSAVTSEAETTVTTVPSETR